MPAFLDAILDGAAPVRLALEPGRSYVVGRGEGADLRLASDRSISRRHAEVALEGEGLRVRRVPEASNPVFFRGEARSEFLAQPGDQFVLGGTRLVFRAGKGASEASPRYAQTLQQTEVYRWGPSERVRLLDLLEIPEALRSKSEPDFHAHVAGLLRLATGARWARVSTADGKVLAEAAGDAGRHRPVSKTLVQTALEEAPRPTLYRWTDAAADSQLTRGEGVDWAICAAATVPGEAPLVFYAAGSDDVPPAAQAENARVVGLVADLVARTISVRRLESRERRLERFFSGPIIRKILEGAGSPETLAPRLAQSTVMFFDIRGFSRQTEGSNEKILEHIGNLKRVLTAMTEDIFREDGVVLQYQGDGLLACWNVPIPDERHVDRACRAALAMSRRIGKVVEGWRCGIGLHTGEVVAGAIGSEQVFSYSLLGAVVNLASRIEGITKFVEAPVLVSREVAERVSPEAAVPVRVGKFRPAGMSGALDLFELAAPPGDPARAAAFAAALEAFERGEWEKAYETLDELPARDLPARFLKSQADQHRRRPPKDWDGVIELGEK